MKYGLYSILDHKTGFLPVNADQNDQSARRNFEHAIQQPGILNTHAEDFELYKVGEFDNETGILTPLPVKELICEGYVYKEEK